MDEAYPDPHRAEIAEQLRSMPPQTIEGVEVYPSELVLELENFSRYGARSLTEQGEKRTGGSPRHWRLLLPSRTYVYGFRSIEFGLPTADMTGFSAEESRFNHELFLDEIVAMNEALNPAVRQLYAKVGGLIVKRASEEEHSIFAGLEVRYKPDEDGNTLQWAHLYYSNAALKTHEYLSRIGRSPRWLREAVQPRNSVKTAESMALSALAAHLNVQRRT